MDVLVGPTFTIDVSPAAETQRLFLKQRVSSLVEEEEEEEDGLANSRLNRLGLPTVGSGKSVEDCSDSSSSSVGSPDDSEDEEEEEEEDGESNSSSSMKKGLGSLGSMDALEDSLPNKRGLSNYFTGKSKSFASLSDACLAVSKAKDLEKPEHPFNKRRRILMANKWSRRSSFYSWHNPKSMPLLTLNEDADDDDHHHESRHREEEAEEEEEEDRRREGPSSSSSSDKDDDGEDKRRGGGGLRKFKNSFKSHSCFSLTDLQEQQRQRELMNLPPRR